MTEIVRIIEDQSSLYSYRATQDENLAQQLESLLETTKPKELYPEWDRLVATPFRYSPPLLNARFRKLMGKNVFYGSRSEETSLYEHAFHFMKQRIHLSINPETGVRTIFAVGADDSGAVSIHKHKAVKRLMDRNDYTVSHQFIENNPQINFIYYPSCRDPNHGDNAAILDITLMNKTLEWESPIKFFYDNNNRVINWLDYRLHIQWKDVV